MSSCPSPARLRKARDRRAAPFQRVREVHGARSGPQNCWTCPVTGADPGAAGPGKRSGARPSASRCRVSLPLGSPRRSSRSWRAAQSVDFLPVRIQPSTSTRTLCCDRPDRCISQRLSTRHRRGGRPTIAGQRVKGQQRAGNSATAPHPNLPRCRFRTSQTRRQAPSRRLARPQERPKPREARRRKPRRAARRLHKPRVLAIHRLLERRARLGREVRRMGDLSEGN
jgi:hypothetical protein